MTRKGGKQEPPLHIDMDFGEALERFSKVDPREVDKSIERSKARKPPGAEAPGGSKMTKGPKAPRTST